MADNAHYPIDVVALWGPEGESELTAASPFGPVHELQRVDAEDANGNEAPRVDRRTLDDVARLADAIAANHSDVLRKSDLDTMRKELEGVFTQQLAVALYELMSAWNSRFAAAEEQMNRRMTTSVEAQTGVLASSMEANFYAVLEIAENVRSELGSFRDRLAGADELPGFQQEIRDEVARVADLATAPRPEATEMVDVAETLKVVRRELAELREEVSDLRAAVDARAPRGLTVRDL